MRQGRRSGDAALQAALAPTLLLLARHRSYRFACGALHHIKGGLREVFALGRHGFYRNCLMVLNTESLSKHEDEAECASKHQRVSVGRIE